MTKRRISDETRAAIIADYLAGMTGPEIGRKYGVGIAYANTVVLRMGIPRRGVIFRRGHHPELLEKRLALGMTRAELADRIGVDVSHLGKWEAGPRRPNKFNLMCWRQALGVSP